VKAKIKFLCAVLCMVNIFSRAQSAVQVASGVNHSVFLKSDGSLWSMGDNYYGQLGDGTITQRDTPVQIASNGVTAIAAGNYHSLFIKNDGSLWVMGTSFDGELGIGIYGDSITPSQIVTSGVIAIACGQAHSLFLKSDGSLWGMGYNSHGQLGDGTTTNRYSPVQIVGSGVTAITCGYNHSLFCKSDGSLWAMGDNGFGQLGDGTTNQRTSPVQIVAGGVSAIAGGYSHSLFLKHGNLWGMGGNYEGELGDGTRNDRHSPVQIAHTGVNFTTDVSGHNLILVQFVCSRITAIACGGGHSLFLTSDGNLWGMGNNFEGELGDGTALGHHSPVQIVRSAPNIGPVHRHGPVRLMNSKITAIACGGGHSLFVGSDGSLWDMGDNLKGQLGDGATIDRHKPNRIVAGIASPHSANGLENLNR
jgi:alpha-tubulin suppressor-like RCC1 family protein